MFNKYFFVLLVLAVLVLPSRGLAADLTYSADTTVTLSSPDPGFTILNGSVATSVTVNTTNIVATIPAASSKFYLRSGSAGIFVLDSTTGAASTDSSISCDSSNNDVATVTTGGSAVTVIFSAITKQCLGSGGG